MRVLLRGCALAVVILVVLVAPTTAGARPQRVVSVNITSDETLLALIPERVVAVSAHSIHVVSQLEALGLRVIRIHGFESIEWIEALIRTRRCESSL